MQYRKLGKTGLDVSVIGFGASALGNVYGRVDAPASEQAVRIAIDSGMNLFDVSPYYGLTLAEERLGQALRGRRDDVYLATKCGRYGSEDFDFSAVTITREFENSLRRLQTDHVDLLQAHDIEFGDVDQIVNETLPAMQRLKEQGKVRSIGLTGYWPGLLARLVFRPEVDSVLNYCHANLFVDDMDTELVPAVERAGIGLLNASPLHMGLLAEAPIPSWHPAPQDVREAALQVRLLCKQYGVNPGTLALRICLDHPAVSSTFVGFSNGAEVQASCDALDWSPPADLLHEVHKTIAPVHNAVWPSGLAKNQDRSVTARLCDASR